MNLRLYLLIIIVILFSCSKEDIEEADKKYPSEISFAITHHLFPGENIKQIEFVDDGFYYSTGNKIKLSDKNGNLLESLDATSNVLSLEYNQKDNSLYFGTYSSGLGKAKGEDVQYFTVENSDLPRNLIRQVECDGAGNIWFNASAHMIGGLVKYDGRRFTKYTPENSDLPENLIYNIRIKNGNIYILSRGNETGKVAFEVKYDKWTRLFESGGCGPTDMDIDSEGNMYFIEDSREYCGGGLMPDEVVFVFKDDKKTILREFEEIMHVPYYLLKNDKRNFLWVCKFESANNRNLSVYNGNTWQQSPENFPNEFINCIEVDSDNNIWLGTINGIYILNQ